MRWLFSLRFKLAFSYAVLSVVPLAVFFFAVMAHIEDDYIGERSSEMRRTAFLVSNIVAAEGFDLLETSAWARSALNRNLDLRSSDWDMRILVFNDAMQVIYDSAETRFGQTVIIPEVMRAVEGYDTTNLRRDEIALYSTMSITSAFDATERIGAVLLVNSVADIFETLDELRRTLLWIIVLVSIVVVIVVFITADTLIRPLRTILRVVQRMATGQLEQRIEEITGRDEYATLAEAFNSMAEKLEQVEKTREEFVSNVSHELKTPLSSMKVLSESILLQEHAPEEMYREFLQDIVNEVDRMTTINNDLLALVRIDQREQGLNISSISMNKTVEDIIKRLTPLSEQKDISLIYDDVRPVQIEADEIKLTLAISNIVENGIKYTPNGGTVKVAVDGDHQFAYISVQDTGMGIPEGEQSKIFNRFYRVDKARDRETGGTGLGLSISHSAVVAHKGTIRVSSKPDEGTVFIVRLPIRRSD
ncbi:MAG: ATP-binding protein [Defluviitaleaceae bacterium]|nr:ATP-binding protein [Defluviitaleaceae bacterium]MCL2273454.1 ATP-binding protein [Defluviitaleaceae bacterium]